RCTDARVDEELDLRCRIATRERGADLLGDLAHDRIRLVDGDVAERASGIERTDDMQDVLWSARGDVDRTHQRLLGAGREVVRHDDLNGMWCGHGYLRLVVLHA